MTDVRPQSFVRRLFQDSEQAKTTIVVVAVLVEMLGAGLGILAMALRP